ncbi:MAG: hypothetical protein R3E39_24365 [Anaerolineae bacterium]
MSARTENRLRQFLLLLTGLTLGSTLVELVLQDHNKELLQWVPFILCVIGGIAVLGVLLRPQRRTILAMRVTMVIVGLGGAIGSAIHLFENFQFEQEIQPTAAAGELIVKTLKGAAPLLAPGVLVFAALLALAATYAHPVLGPRE